MSHRITYDRTKEIALERYPELKRIFGASNIERALDDGSYILYEDYVVPLIVSKRQNKDEMKKASDFIEMLLLSPDANVRNLAEIAVLEGIVINELVEIIPWLKAASIDSLHRVASRIELDENIWLGNEPFN